MPTIRKSGRMLALTCGAISPLFLSAVLHAQAAAEPATTPATSTDDKDLVVLEKFEVTGSRIKRIDPDAVSPVIAYHPADIEASGYPTLADAIRSLPFNNGQALTPTDSGTSFTPGVNSFNLRGLGNNNTLVLINGRRAVPYAAPGFNGFQTVFDLNSIPDAALDSLEILKDGGSALYGSDAVAGVVNFKLKRDYTGAYVKLKYGNYFNTDGALKQASFVAGTSSAKTSIFVAGSWEKQNPVYARELDYSANAQKDDRASKIKNAYYVLDSASGYTLEDFGLTDPVSDTMDWEWFDNRSGTGYPGFIAYDFNGNGTISSGERRSYTEPTSNPTTGTAVNGLRHFYNFQEVAGLFPEYDRFAFFTSLKHNFTEALYGFAEVSFTRSHALSDAAPTPAVIANEQGLTQGSRMTIPSYNAYNPWGVDITSGARRLVELGNRINDVTADTPRVLVGLGGDLKFSDLLSDWAWESAVLYSKNSVTNLNRNSVADYKLQQALNGLTRDAGNGTLSWNPNTPLNERVYFNWFGLNSKEMADFLSIENPTHSSLRYFSFDGSASGTVMDLPGGRLGMAIGFEHRSEKLADVQTDLNATSMIVGGSAGSSSFGSRSVDSVYAEATLPFHKMVELQVAGRYEDYSDEGFEDEIRPKVSLKLKPLDWLVFRGSFSESFKAPDLAYLYSSSTTTFTSSQYVDPVTGSKLQIQDRVAGNPDLKPETTKTYYAGVVIEPQKGLFKGLSLSLDWFQFEQTNLLAQMTDFYGYDDVLLGAMNGDAFFVNKVVRDPVSQELLYVVNNYDNLGKRRYRGYDFEARYQWETKNWGRFYTGIGGTYIASDKLNGDELVGSKLTPRIIGTGSFTWMYRDWTWNLFAHYINERDDSMFFGDLTGAGDYISVYYTIRRQITLNTSVSYAGLWDTKVTVGVNNLLNQDPPLDPFEASGTTPGVNDPYPAFWYISLEREF
ncbi:MAG: TonB-dependent receptor [Opitutaceae bacterium]